MSEKQQQLFIDLSEYKISALTKIAYSVVAIFVPLLLGFWQLFLFTIVVSLSLLVYGKVLQKALKLLSFISLMLLTIVVIQTTSSPHNATILYVLVGVELYVEGFYIALEFIMKIINLVVASSVFILTTPPQELERGLTLAKVPYKIKYIIVSVFQIIPQLLHTVHQIQQAQESRGLAVRGSFVIRIKALFPLLVPAIITSLIAVKERTIALEVRGFSLKGKKTSILGTKLYVKDYIILWMLGGIVVIAIGGKIILWLILK